MNLIIIINEFDMLVSKIVYFFPVDTLKLEDENERHIHLLFGYPTYKLTFTIKRDDSSHNSIIKYTRLENNKEETFTFNTGSYSDNTVVTYDGVSLTCTAKYGKSPQCNNLPLDTPVPAKIIEIDFNPRDGKAHKNQWQRNGYTISAGTYTDGMKTKGT